jgi:hypothetical protein
VEMKLKTDESCNGLHQTLLPQLYHFHCIKPQRQFSLLIGHINRDQGGSGLIVTSPIFHMHFLD